MNRYVNVYLVKFAKFHTVFLQIRMLNQYSTPTYAASPSISTSSTTPPPPSLQQPPTSISASSTSPSLPHNVSFIEFCPVLCTFLIIEFMKNIYIFVKDIIDDQIHA